MGRGTLVSVMVVAGALAAPGSAHAVGCAGLPRGQKPPPPPVSFDAIALSGPNVLGTLFTPARLHVLRYIRGSGPRVVRLANGVERDGRSITMTDDFHAEMGGTYRVNPSLETGSRIRRNQLVGTSVCNGTREIQRPRSLRSSRLRVAPTEAGARWRARLVRGPFGLRCVETRRVDRISAAQRQCERIASPTAAVLGLHTAGSGTNASTLVVAQAPRLRSLRIDSAGKVETLRAALGSRVTARAYNGALAPETIRLTLQFAGGVQRHVSLAVR